MDSASHVCFLIVAHSTFIEYQGPVISHDLTQTFDSVRLSLRESDALLRLYMEVTIILFITFTCGLRDTNELRYGYKCFVVLVVKMKKVVKRSRKC